LRVPGSLVISRFSWKRHETQFNCMLILTVTPSCSY
jgi:hypothetical protein